MGGLQILGNGDVYSRRDAVAMRLQTGCDGILVARGSIRTAGYIFNANWQDDDESVVAAADALEQRYATLSEQFGGPRQKLEEYHSESFRRIRARGSRQVLRERWTAFEKWLKHEQGRHKETQGNFHKGSVRGKLVEFFADNVKISFCSISPLIERVYEGAAGAAQFSSLLAHMISDYKNSVYLPMEEAKEDPRQIIISLSNTCTVTFLYDQSNRIFRASMLCARFDSEQQQLPLQLEQ